MQEMREPNRMMEETHHPEKRVQPGVEQWLRSYPWEDIVRTVAGYWRRPPEEIEACAAQETRALWQHEAAGPQSLCEALRLCRACQAARPFGKFECESFVIVARDMVEPWLGQMSATLAAAVITIIADYVRGGGDETEMERAANMILEKYIPPAPSGQSGSPAGL